jgi:hypothetical protein
MSVKTNLMKITNNLIILSILYSLSNCNTESKCNKKNNDDFKRSCTELLIRESTKSRDEVNINLTLLSCLTIFEINQEAKEDCAKIPKNVPGI